MKKLVLILALTSAAVVAPVVRASTPDVVCLGEGVETMPQADGTCDKGTTRIDLRKWREAGGDSKVSVSKNDDRVLVGPDTFQPSSTYLLIHDENSVGFVAFDSKSACAKYAASTHGQCLSAGQATLARAEFKKHQ
jgi:hypothetical protein